VNEEKRQRLKSQLGGLEKPAPLMPYHHKQLLTIRKLNDKCCDDRNFEKWKMKMENENGKCQKE